MSFDLLDRLKVGYKIFLLVFFSVLIMVFLTYKFFDFLQQTEQQLHHLKQNEMVILRATKDLQREIIESHASLLLKLSLYEEGDKKLLLETKEKILHQFDQLVKLGKNIENKKLLEFLENSKFRYKVFFNLGMSVLEDYELDGEDRVDAIYGMEDLSIVMMKELDNLVTYAENSFDTSVDSFTKEIEIAKSLTILLGVIGVIVIIFYSILISRKITEPIYKVQKGFVKFLHLLKDHDFTQDYTITIQSKDELGTLAKGFNKMATSIHRLYYELEEHKNNLEFLVEEKTKEIQANVKLLEQYKFAIDTTTIVTKTDLDGVVTYANDSFYKISKFGEDEIIGHSHNVVRDPNVPKEVFQDMWKTINSGKVWSGQISGQAKDKTIYHTNATVIPIKNVDDEIIEYFGIRTDISEIINLNREIIETQKDVISTMGEIGESRSKETGNHVRRVAKYSLLLAQLYGLSKEECELLYYASPMHDIGKIAIPDRILNKPGKLTEDEFRVMQTHAALGYEMLKSSDRPIMKAAAIISYEHHEKFDGTGYPNKKSGDDIHIYGRITALADVFDALGSNRCYKKAWELPIIVAHITEQKARHFDPHVVDLFLNNLEKFLKIRDQFKDV
ncbi:MAG: HD domain-containing protein [Campylobacterales bacterium]|nr:HD domain-containing protein [Campylobacterales bacterium]